MLDTEADNQFWQLGVGVEFGNRYLEFRGNYYIPLSDKQVAEQFKTREVLQSSSTSRSQSVTPLNNPYATGYTIAQDALYTTRATTTTRTTTIDRLFSRYEEGMEAGTLRPPSLCPGSTSTSISASSAATTASTTSPSVPRPAAPAMWKAGKQAWKSAPSPPSSSPAPGMRTTASPAVTGPLAYSFSFPLKSATSVMAKASGAAWATPSSPAAATSQSAWLSPCTARTLR
ncbi:inverse autotransporter beta domain-containing protein [Verrucomicrobium spinosum]|uniref:inverse autotransporter beta domain-containing protein n=1 Tax=Verrucomicrobium spinosum TaxID=2736 RepID=UPI00094676AC